MRFSCVILIAAFLVTACSGRNDRTSGTAASPINTGELQPVAVQSEDLSDHPGKQLYNQHCLACHQADGNGVPGMFPPLTDPDWIDGENERLISVVIHGLDEEIVVNGEKYNTIMVPMPHLSDREVMDVLNYVRREFGTSEKEITLEEVEKVRASGS